MEIELIQDGEVIDFKEYKEVIENVKDSLFRKNKDNEETYICNFVGIILDVKRIILSLPKSINIKNIENKETLLYKYARVFDLYLIMRGKRMIM